MKSERRHSLEHNVLAQWVSDTVEVLKPHATTIVAALLVVVVVVGAGIFWQRTSQKASAGAWNELYTAFSSGRPGDLEDVAKSHPKTDAAHWAALLAADLQLTEGCNEIFSSKATGAQEIRNAVDHYRTVLKETRTSGLRERATFGLARAYETLAGTEHSQGEFDKAIEQYQELLDNWPEGPYAKMAERRLKSLSADDAAEFFGKLAKFDPQPAFVDDPGTPGEGPIFDESNLTPPASGTRTEILPPESGTPDKAEPANP